MAMIFQNTTTLRHRADIAVAGIETRKMTVVPGSNVWETHPALTT
ncbi:hypothetical protein N184_07005 [Sinorhizobium sp. GL28]|nr:hypothetical protein N184_07005 [Sinorhizobium sp. GL28]